jgi:hypothetical protein
MLSFFRINLFIVCSVFLLVSCDLFSKESDEYIAGQGIKKIRVNGTHVILFEAPDQGALGGGGWPVLVQRKFRPKDENDYRILCRAEGKKHLDFEFVPPNSIKCIIAGKSSVVRLPLGPSPQMPITQKCIDDCAEMSRKGEIKQGLDIKSCAQEICE